jgi:biopolymer transport protein ExbB/TolQ
MESAPSSHPSGPRRRYERFWTDVLAACLGVGVVVFFNLVGPLQVKSRNSEGVETVKLDFSRLVVDWASYRAADGRLVNERNWFSVQAVMWVALFVGFGELWTRRREMAVEERLTEKGLLPEDERTMLSSRDLKPIYRKARIVSPGAVLPTMIRRLVMEFRKSGSVDRVNSILDSSLELYLHRLELRYTLARYLVWLIPTLGFLGTVMGIASAMGFAGSGAVAPEDLLGPTTRKLAVAFYTTWLALIQSAVLLLGMTLLQAAEERTLNEAGQYCLDNLVLRLVEPARLRADNSADEIA